MLLSIVVSIGLTVAVGQFAPRPEVAPGLEALREGRFDEAGRWFDRVTSQAPGAPEGPFFQAFQIWWRLLDDPDATGTLRARMEGLLEGSARLAEGLAGSTEQDVRERGLVFAGVSRLLEAQSLAGRGEHWSAASMARKGHRSLTDALAINPDSADALFALGAYDYYADNLPLMVKGIRWLLAIPPGDETRGIARLETAADRSALFGTESLMLLTHIYAGGFEEDHRRALDYVHRARGRHADSPLIALVESDLLYDLGRFRDAMIPAQKAGRIIEGSGAVFAQDLSRFAQLRIATLELASRQPAAALARAEAALACSLPATQDDAERWGRLLLAAAREAGRIDAAAQWLAKLPLEPKMRRRLEERLAAARGDIAARELAAVAITPDADAELRTLRGLLERFPGDRRIQYALGRRLQMEGLLEEARPNLSAAARGGQDEIAGWAMIRLGWALEHAGARARALPFYRRAAEIKHFSFRAAARDRLEHPVSDPPEG